jgi:hypothetical protein
MNTKKGRPLQSCQLTLGDQISVSRSYFSNNVKVDGDNDWKGSTCLEQPTTRNLRGGLLNVAVTVTIVAASAAVAVTIVALAVVSVVAITMLGDPISDDLLVASLLFFGGLGGTAIALENRWLLLQYAVVQKTSSTKSSVLFRMMIVVIIVVVIMIMVVIVMVFAGAGQSDPKREKYC